MFGYPNRWHYGRFSKFQTIIKLPRLKLVVPVQNYLFQLSFILKLILLLIKNQRQLMLQLMIITYDNLPKVIGKNLPHNMVILIWYVYRISLIFDWWIMLYERENSIIIGSLISNSRTQLVPKFWSNFVGVHILGMIFPTNIFSYIVPYEN